MRAPLRSSPTSGTASLARPSRTRSATHVHFTPPRHSKLATLVPESWTASWSWSLRERLARTLQRVLSWRDRAEWLLVAYQLLLISDMKVSIVYSCIQYMYSYFQMCRATRVLHVHVGYTHSLSRCCTVPVVLPYEFMCTVRCTVPSYTNCTVHVSFNNLRMIRTEFEHCVRVVCTCTVRVGRVRVLYLRTWSDRGLNLE